jgi:hypothetical protein
VAGAAALYWEKYPKATNVEVVRAFLNLPKRKVIYPTAMDTGAFDEPVWWKEETRFPALDLQKLLRDLPSIHSNKNKI